MNTSKKPVIAHYNHKFFSCSETFIYNYISHLKRFHPICLAWEIVPLEQFPFPKEDLYPVSFKKYSLKWLLVGGLRKYSTRDLYTEKIIKKRNAELIHAHFGQLGVYALKLKRSLNIPLITTFYGWDISVLAENREWRLKYKTLFEEGDLFLVEGPHMKTKLLNLGCPEEKIMIQRIAIPLDKIQFRPRKPKKSDGNVILIFCGRLEEKKGILYALKAVGKIREWFKNIEFRIIGEGILRPEIETYIKTHHMNDYTVMLGFLNYDEYLEEMNKADIFVHPSVVSSTGNSEGGAPTTILEAQATGMPVVSTYHADIPNVVVPEKSALLSKEKDYNEVANNIKYLLENQETWEQMGSIGREFVETYHNIYNEVDRLEEIYSQLL